MGLSESECGRNVGEATGGGNPAARDAGPGWPR